jgi:hypothetical protein
VKRLNGDMERCGLNRAVRQSRKWHERRRQVATILMIKQSVSCTWQDLAQGEGIPKVYWTTVDLGRFCAASVDEWWDWLWACILKDKEVLIPGRDPSKVQTQIHDYFLTLVDARENGTF